MGDQAKVAELVKRYKALRDLEDVLLERMATIRDEDEEQRVDSLICRAFAPQCEWDRRNSHNLLFLALTPNDISWFFRAREYAHRLFHYFWR